VYKLVNVENLKEKTENAKENRRKEYEPLRRLEVLQTERESCEGETQNKHKTAMLLSTGCCNIWLTGLLNGVQYSLGHWQIPHTGYSQHVMESAVVLPLLRPTATRYSLEPD
jgi:hypothetical protein